MLTRMFDTVQITLALALTTTFGVLLGYAGQLLSWIIGSVLILMVLGTGLVARDPSLQSLGLAISYLLAFNFGLAYALTIMAASYARKST